MLRIIALLLIGIFTFSSCSKEYSEESTLHPLEGEYSGLWDYGQDEVSKVRIFSTSEDHFFLTFISDNEVTYVISMDSDNQFSISSFQAWGLNNEFMGELIGETLYVDFEWSEIDDPSVFGSNRGEFIKVK